MVWRIKFENELKNDVEKERTSENRRVQRDLTLYIRLVQRVVCEQRAHDYENRDRRGYAFFIGTRGEKHIEQFRQ